MAPPSIKRSQPPWQEPSALMLWRPMANRGILGPSLSRATLSVIVTVGVALTALTVTASWSALRSHERPFAGLFIDPHASFSAVWWPTWGAGMPSLKFPDRLVAIDGEPVPPPRTAVELPSQPIAARLAALSAQGHTEVRLTFATHAAPATIVRRLRARAADEALFFFGLYALVALFVLWSGLAVLMLARRRAGAVAYAAWSVGTFIFMVTFYDYHSTVWLAPLFSLSTASLPVCVVWLAYSFPEPPRVGRRLLRGAAIAFTAVCAAGALLLAIGPYLPLRLQSRLPLNLTALRFAVTPIAFACLLVLSASILYRLRVERGRRRQELLSSAIGLAAVPALIAFGFFMQVGTGTTKRTAIAYSIRSCF